MAHDPTTHDHTHDPETARRLQGKGLATRGRATPQSLQMASHLRRNPTPTEKLAWDLLRERRLFGLKFRRQQVILGFIVDFYCPELNLSIELDGPCHDTDEAISYDEKRRLILERRGVREIRICNEHLSRELLEAFLKPFLSPPKPSHPTDQE